MLVRGAIYHHTNMTFYDGKRSNKYIILLNNPSDKIPCCFVKTTSKPRGPATPGCLEENILFFIPPKSEFFPKPTWVQLFEVYPYAKESICKENGINYCEVLSEKTTNQIVQCLHKCAMDDIPRNLHQYLQRSLPAEVKKLAEKFNRRRN